MKQPIDVHQSPPSSESPEISTGIKKHPCAVAWYAWKARNVSLFRGDARDQYLENRLNAAFLAGWSECEQAVTKALR